MGDYFLRRLLERGQVVVALVGAGIVGGLLYLLWRLW